MTYLRDEIASQPAVWSRVLDMSVSGLPEPGERVAVIGCGTSYYMAQAYAALREAAGQGETDPFPASEFPIARPYDRVVALTRSGTTTEVLAALAATRAPTVALTGKNVVVGIRPEGWILKPAGEGVAATIEVIEELGSEQFLYCSTSAPQLASEELGEADTTAPPPITVRAEGMSSFQRGEKVGLVPQPGAVHLFDAATGDRLPD